MGNTLGEQAGIFGGDVVEDYLCGWGAVPSGYGAASEGKVGYANLPGGPDQPQDGLQVVEAVYGPGSGRVAGPIATSAASAATNGPEVGRADSAVAASAAVLGSQEAAGGAAAALGRRGAERSNDGAVAAAVGDSASGAATPPSGVRVAPAGADGGVAGQPGLDGGFQGVVSDWGGAASGSADGAGPLQSVWVGGEGVARSKLAAGAWGVCEAVPAVGSAGADSGGQWESVWIDGARRAVAVERVVDASGDRGGVYPTRASRTERGGTSSIIECSSERRRDPRHGACGANSIG